MADGSKVRIDAKTFQEPLWKVAETMAQKVKREGPARLGGPVHIADDIHVMVRHAMATYSLLNYLNADERRKDDCYWNNTYGVVSAPLVRTMIDCLYNITFILQDPATNGPWYRKSGLKKRLEDIQEDQKVYGGMQEWDDYNASLLRGLDILIRGSGYTEEDIKTTKRWPTLGQYLQAKPENLTAHQRFLKSFTHMQWRQYSGLLHGGHEGYIGELTPGAYLVIDSFLHEDRTTFDARYEDFLTRHLGRAATVLLCIATEIQAHFLFQGANIDVRICKMWEALIPVFEAGELYDEHYRELMKETGILPRE